MRYGIFGDLKVPMALGLLRLSCEGRPSEADAVALIHAALDAGVRILDTADSYALDERDLHYGERLAQHALATWSGPREQVFVLTKAGMARPKGRWVPNARPAHLRAAVDRSLQALQVDRLPMFLLHGNDPGCAFEDSLATLADLQREGKIHHLGLCNVDVAEIRQAQRLFPVVAIQNELSVMNRKAAAEATLLLARDEGIAFLAHRPLGGHAKVDNLLKNRAMKPIAERYKMSPHRAALAVLMDRSGTLSVEGAPLIALFGASTLAHLQDSLAATTVTLDTVDIAGVVSKLNFQAEPEAAALLAPLPLPQNHAAHGGEPEIGPRATQEVVLLMGVQGAGKSSRVQAFEAAGYVRLNRDAASGSLDDLLPQLAQALADGRSVVLDNTYANRTSRWPVIRAAHRAGVPVRCVHLATPVREALINIVHRMLDRYGGVDGSHTFASGALLPGPDELKALAKDDPNLPPPLALARYAARFEAPQLDEGFSRIDDIAFVRQTNPAHGSRKALLLDVDGTLRRTLSGAIYPTDPADIELLPGRRECLAKWLAQGWVLCFVSNQSGVASGSLTAQQADACFDRTIELLGLPVLAVAYCPHTAFPAGCFCRKPMPGMGVALARKHGLDLGQSIMVGDMQSDADFAAAIGARYLEAEHFFKSSVDQILTM
jgi:histidinol-phosphate phosphatase family protein